MRYWSQRQICQAIEETGLSGLEFRADGFFSQNPQLADLDLFSLTGTLVVLTSYAGCKAAALQPQALSDRLLVAGFLLPVRGHTSLYL